MKFLLKKKNKYWNIYSVKKNIKKIIKKQKKKIKIIVKKKIYLKINYFINIKFKHYFMLCLFIY